MYTVLRTMRRRRSYFFINNDTSMNSCLVISPLYSIKKKHLVTFDLIIINPLIPRTANKEILINAFENNVSSIIIFI